MTIPDTLLVIEGIGLPPRAALGLDQTLEPVNESTSLMRTVDGALDDLSLSQFRKYKSKISCTLFESPALDGIWPGQQVVVHCVPELSYEEPSGGETVPGEGAARTIVTGSVRTRDGFVYYRPKLTMRVVSFDIKRDEYGATTGWSLELEEV